MKEEAHTAGPWNIDPSSGRDLVWDGRQIVAQAFTDRHVEYARLIAAAPELLEALKAISAGYERTDVNHADFRVRAKEIADAAILKATGGDRP